MLRIDDVGAPGSFEPSVVGKPMKKLNLKSWARWILIPFVPLRDFGERDVIRLSLLLLLYGTGNDQRQGHSWTVVCPSIVDHLRRHRAGLHGWS